jgi:hypothetical protein
MANWHKAGENIPNNLIFVSLFVFDTIVILGAIVLGTHKGNSLLYFGKHSFITWISVFQLLTISLLSYIIFQTRGGTLRHFSWRAPYTVWTIVSIGFLFLAMDDLFEIHESIDHRIHNIFNLEESALSDRFDDMIVGLYGLIGLSSLYYCREEIKKYRQILPFLICGFVFLFIMVAMDAIANRNDIFQNLVHHDLADFLYIICYVGEDPVKIFGESFFLVGFYSALQIARGKATKSAIHEVTRRIT